jgi:hypothetical protein
MTSPHHPRKTNEIFSVFVFTRFWCANNTTTSKQKHLFASHMCFVECLHHLFTIP